MPHERLSTKERAVLLALLAEARELTNRELADRVGFRLEGKERRTLNEQGLVESRMAGRAYVHALSDKGGLWCADELSAGPGPRAGSMERALYAILGGIRRYLAGVDDPKARKLTELFAAPTDVDGGPPARADVQARIVAAYRRGVGGDFGTFMRLADLRADLAALPRDAVDEALVAMYVQQRVNLVPKSEPGRLTTADRRAALRVGGEDKHRIAIQTP